jgi:protein-disulfide isomerase
LKSHVLLATFVAAVFACEPAPETNRPQVARAGVGLGSAPFKGAEEAPITIIEFMDYECGYCRRAESTIAQVLATYPGQVRVQVVNMPLPFHQHAELAARAVYAAQEQGRYFELHERLITSKEELDKDTLLRHAAAVGLDLEQFKNDLESSRVQSAIERDREMATKLEVRGTPAFFINGRKVVGAQPFAAFKKIIDEELGRAPKSALGAEADETACPHKPDCDC